MKGAPHGRADVHLGIRTGAGHPRGQGGAGGGDPRVPRSHRAPRPHASRLHHGGRGRRAGRGRGARARGGGGGLARPAPRGAARPQGSFPDPGPAHLVRDPHSRLLGRRPALHRGDAAAGGRRPDPGQAQHDRAGAGSLRRQRPPRRRAEPVAHRSRLGRLEQRVGRGGGGGAGGGRARHGHRRLHPLARGGLRGGGAQADLRPREPRRRHAALLVLRPRGSARPHRARRGADAHHDRGRGPAGRNHEPAAGAGLCRGPRRERRRAPDRSGRGLLRRRPRRHRDRRARGRGDRARRPGRARRAPHGPRSGPDRVGLQQRDGAGGERDDPLAAAQGAAG